MPTSLTRSAFTIKMLVNIGHLDYVEVKESIIPATTLIESEVGAFKGVLRMTSVDHSMRRSDPVC